MSQDLDSTLPHEDSTLDDAADPAFETPTENVFVPPSIHNQPLLAAQSYTHHSDLPPIFHQDDLAPFVLGVDEAGRGPVLGPMVYGVAYLPVASQAPILKTQYHFDDSKALSPTVRSDLMKALCTPGTDLHNATGWAVRTMSARDISAGMMRAAGTYNLNAQAVDATIDLIHQVYAKGVNITEIYIDTIGRPETYQKRLERIFPTARITVAKKADSLYPCVSAASVCAKVTRDAALEVCYESIKPTLSDASLRNGGWGSGYPSDARCVTWLKSNMHPLFGWGSECRFSWGTAKDLLEAKTAQCKVEWPAEDDDEDADMKLTTYFASPAAAQDNDQDPLANWFGTRVSENVF